MFENAEAAEPIQSCTPKQYVFPWARPRNAAVVATPPRDCPVPFTRGHDPVDDSIAYETETFVKAPDGFVQESPMLFEDPSEAERRVADCVGRNPTSEYPDEFSTIGASGPPF